MKKNFLFLFLALTGGFLTAADAKPLAMSFAKPEVIPQRLHLILGMAEETGYRLRLKAVHKLGAQLHHQEVRALLWFLHKKDGEDPLPLTYVNPIKNDITAVLMKQERRVVDLGRHLVAMYRNRSLDPVWRDYCIQFLGVWYPKVWNESERADIRQVFYEALAELRGTIPGTALIALANLADDPDFDRAEIVGKALALASNENAGTAGRITALQICARFNCTDVLPVARRLAAEKGDACLRMSAIAAIGTLGDASDLALLQRTRKSSDIRLRKAARSAIMRLERRI